MSNEPRNRSGAPPLPKPYEFVPFAPRVERRAPVGHHRYAHMNGVLHARIIARSPVHVASGLLEQTRDQRYPLIKAHFRVSGTPVIPGTSLKGCIRSIVEAISPSSVSVTRTRQLPRELRASDKPESLDVSQRVFGALGYQGQVRFSDAVLTGGQTEILGTPQLFRPRPEAPIYLDERGRLKGRKFYMHGKLAPGDLPLEVCPIGSAFTFRMDFENLTPGELGLLLIALGLGDPRLYPKLGGGKPACLGTIEVVEPRIEIAEPTKQWYTDFDTPVTQAGDIPALLQAARDEQLVLDDQVRRLAGILRWPRDDRQCPNWSY
ncbi:MAG: RAMP superfamily CRISPR-associated protein [Roseiflexaceae bacterium]|nr:RAMP superfamily CRISPR-associated protein [Roseiflexaceae bacterium]